MLIGLASLAGRRWGPAVSGWLFGLPLTSAPVALFLTFEQGPEFAVRVAQGSLAGLVSQALFCIAYAWLSFRAGWVACWLGAWAVYLATTALLAPLAIAAAISFAALLGVLLLALLLWPPSPPAEDMSAPPASAWEIAARMLIGTGMVLALTGAAVVLGPRLSGLLATFPIFSTLFAIFTHRFHSAPAARYLLRGVLVSSFACAVFFVLVISLLRVWGPAAAFGAATLGALLTQGTALWIDRQRFRLRLRLT